ncbi:MAG: hypothetical protein LBH74_09420 [Nitrososphaerota archaeon]|jgi:hypothetical protein|nr:hypothetical protein [Nitrososphaerota archaeon]
MFEDKDDDDIQRSIHSALKLCKQIEENLAPYAVPATKQKTAHGEAKHSVEISPNV